MCAGLRCYRKNISQVVCCKKVDLGRMCDISCQSMTFSLIVASSGRHGRPSRVRLWFPRLLLHNSLHAAEIYDALRLAALRCVKTAADRRSRTGRHGGYKIKASVALSVLLKLHIYFLILSLCVSRDMYCSLASLIQRFSPTFGLSDTYFLFYSNFVMECHEVHLFKGCT